MADDTHDPLFDALWERVLSGWDDDKAHSAVLDHAIRTHALPELAGRYRPLASDPNKGEIAKKKLDAIVIAATQMLMSMRTPKPGKVPLPITLSAVAVSMIMLAWLAFALWGRH
jgi:hypothetical protein